MSISRIVPPLDYLKEASRASLQSFELARLNHAANLRREIGALIDQWIKESSEAMLARWMLDRNGFDGSSLLPANDRKVAALLIKSASGSDVQGELTEILNRRL